MKVVCQCGMYPNGYIGIPAAGKTKKGDFLWVHTRCGYPTRLVWEGFISRCPGCLVEFSNPWETYCRDCFYEEYDEYLTKHYRTYSNARKQIGLIIQIPHAISESPSEGRLERPPGGTSKGFALDSPKSERSDTPLSTNRPIASDEDQLSFEFL